MVTITSLLNRLIWSKETKRQYSGQMSQTFKSVKAIEIQGGGGGATWYQPCPCVCVQKWRIGVPYQLIVDDMNEKMLFRMGVKSAVLFYMDRTF